MLKAAMRERFVPGYGSNSAKRVDLVKALNGWSDEDAKFVAANGLEDVSAPKGKSNSSLLFVNPLTSSLI